jgi:methyl-accepting chemotaxis protein
VYLDKWDLTVGTQVNLDDLEVQVQAIVSERYQRIGQYTAYVLALAGFLLVLVAFVGIWLGNSLTTDRHQFDCEGGSRHAANSHLPTIQR